MTVAGALYVLLGFVTFGLVAFFAWALYTQWQREPRRRDAE